MKLTDNFSYDEFFVSSEHPDLAAQAKENVPDMLMTTLHLLCRFILQPVRDKLGVPIIITSGYRDNKLNRAIKGSAKNSLHRQGIAADFTIADTFGDGKLLLLKAFQYIGNSLPHGELILYEAEEGNFINIHVSLPSFAGQHFTKRKVRLKNGKLKDRVI